MNRSSVKAWKVTQPDASIDLLAALKSKFIFEVDPTTESMMTLMDDFDAHLWHADYLLCRDDKKSLRLLNTDGKAEDIKISPEARFSWQLPDGPAKNIIKNLIGLRALVPIENLCIREQHIELRNDDQKLVVRAYLRSIKIDEQDNQYFAIRALRGYTKEFTTARNTIDEFSNLEPASFELKNLLSAYAIPAFTQTKINLLKLTDNMPTEQAVRAMAIVMLQQARIQVPGIIADIDTEFLHQFRVSFRKLRSLVSLLQKSLPPETVALLKPTLSAIAGATNKLRDLDVFLLEKNYYRAMLPDNFSAGLAELYELIEQQRALEKTAISHYFSSPGYSKNMELCAAEFSATAALQTAMSTKHLLPVVKKLLASRYHKMQAMAAIIQTDTLDEEVHQLRIEFKKLRYLIEFFSSLLPLKRINNFLGEMKKIQGILGNFNDYSIQIEFLNTYVDDSKIEMSKALSGLIAILHQHKIAERKKVDSALTNFFTPAMNNEVEFLFGATASGAAK